MAWHHELGFWLAVGVWAVLFVALFKFIVGRLLPIPGLQQLAAAV